MNASTINVTKIIIDIGKNFSRYPAGRYETDGPFNGELFRTKFLVPALVNQQNTTIDLDNTAGYGSSFLEEAFGGLVRIGYSSAQIKTVISLHSEDPSLIDEIENQAIQYHTKEASNDLAFQLKRNLNQKLRDRLKILKTRNLDVKTCKAHLIKFRQAIIALNTLNRQ